MAVPGYTVVFLGRTGSGALRVHVHIVQILDLVSGKSIKSKCVSTRTPIVNRVKYHPNLEDPFLLQLWNEAPKAVIGMVFWDQIP